MNENCCNVDWGRDPSGGAFALFLRAHREAFGSLSVPTPGNLPPNKKNGNAWGLARGRGGSWK